MAEPLTLDSHQSDRLAPAQQLVAVQRFVDRLHRKANPIALSAGRLDLAAVQEAIRVAGTAPSGANQQPWQYVLVTDPARRQLLRQAAMVHEVSRQAHLPEEWLSDSEPCDRTLLETSPGLIAVFRANYQAKPDGSRQKHYYTHESAALSVSFLLAALQHAGIPFQLQPPVAAMSQILERPGNESPFFLIPVGRAAAGSLAAVHSFGERMRTRRSIREFSSEPVPPELMQEILAAADAAPAPAGLKPWRFELVSEPGLRREIRHLVEEQEKRFYESRITPQWQEALAPLGTNWQKPFVETAPHLIVCFKVDPVLEPDAPPPEVDSFVRGARVEQTLEAAAIAAGFVIGALHHAGLSCLTHTPSPMHFLRTVLGRPQHETPFLLLPVGYPAEGHRLPDIQRKPLSEILTVL